MNNHRILSDSEFGREIESRRNKLYSFASRYRKTRSDIEDLVQETMLRAWTYRNNFKEISDRSLTSWMMMILRNIYIGQWRHEKIVRFEPIEIEFENDKFIPIMNEQLSISGGQEENIVLSEAIHFVAQIPPEQAIALILNARGNSYEHSAKIMRVPIGTVKSRVCRAKQTLLGMVNQKPKTRYRSNTPIG